jgi:hypothetical protein
MTRIGDEIFSADFNANVKASGKHATLAMQGNDGTAVRQLGNSFAKLLTVADFNVAFNFDDIDFRVGYFCHGDVRSLAAVLHASAATMATAASSFDPIDTIDIVVLHCLGWLISAACPTPALFTADQPGHCPVGTRSLHSAS